MNKNKRFGLVAMILIIAVSILSLTYYVNDHLSRTSSSAVINVPLQAPNPLP